MKQRLLSLSLALLTLLSLNSCTGEDDYDSEYLCYFTYDFTLHGTGVLRDAVLSPGLFVYVYRQTKSGVPHIYARLNDGVSGDETAITTDKENYQNWTIGIKNGLIIGQNSFGELCAYDHQCPNCIRANRSGTYDLSWTNSGRYVKCANCSLEYDLNSNGIVVEGEGRKLIKYHVAYTGSMLVVSN